jgi:hypothetical protein
MSPITLTAEAKTLEADVRDELVVIGHNEEGREVIGLRFHVTLTDEAGHRWRHFRQFCTSEVKAGYSEFDGFLEVNVIDNRVADAARAQKLADAVNAHLAAGGSVNPDCWLPTDTVYGSTVWDREDEAELALFD